MQLQAGEPTSLDASLQGMLTVMVGMDCHTCLLNEDQGGHFSSPSHSKGLQWWSREGGLTYLCI